jgi:hypothetical protein
MRNNAKQTDQCGQSMSIITYSVGNAETQPSSAINLYRLGRMLIIIETQSGWWEVVVVVFITWGWCGCGLREWRAGARLRRSK